MKVGKGEVADFLAGPGVFQEFQHRRFLELALIFLRFGRVGCFPVAEVRKSFEGRRAGRHFFGAKILQRHRVPGDVEQLVVALLLPVLERILVKQVQIFGDLRLPEHLFVLLTRSANHPRHQRGCRRQMVGREGQSLRVEIIDGQVAVGMNDDGPRAFLDRRGVDAVGKPFFDDDGVTEITFGLRKQVANRDRFPRARHAQQNRVLWRFIVLRTGERLDADEIILRPVVNCLRRCQVPGEGAGHRQHVRQETVLGIKFAMFVTSPCPARPGLEEKTS